MKISARTQKRRRASSSQLMTLLLLLVSLLWILDLASASNINNNANNQNDTKGYHRNNTMETVGRRRFPELDVMDIMDKGEGFWKDLTAHRRMQTVSPACQSSTESLQTRASFANEFQKVQQFADDTATNRQCQEFTVSQENTKLTCTLDYGNAVHDLRNICSNVYGAIYSESNYTYRCDKVADKNFLVYNELNVPLCVSIVCGQTGWRSYQVAGAESIGAWLAAQAYANSTCDRLRLEPQFATLASDIPQSCGEDTDQIMEKMDTATPGLAQHRSTKVIECTNNQANGCSIDFSQYDHGFEKECRENTNTRGIYIEVDYSISCTKNAGGGNLNLQVTNDPFCASQILCEVAEYGTEAADVRPISMIALLTTEGYTCTYGGDLVFEDFKRSLSPSISSAPSVSMAPSQVPSISNKPSISISPSFVPSLQGCSGASDDLMSQNQVVRQTMETIQSEIEKNPAESYCTGAGQIFCDYDYTGISHTLLEDCRAQDGTYIEHSYQIICLKPASGEETVTRHIDRPFCLDNRCEYVEMSDFINQHYQSQTPDSDTLCISYALQELLVGGRADVEAIPVSPGCQYETNQMSSTTAILNAKAVIRSDYKQFATREIRNYCPSKQAGILECDFDFSSNILAITNNLKGDCPTSGGQYLTSAFTAVCTDPVEGVQVTFKIRNYPNCVGFCCKPGESKTILDAEHTWFTDYYIIERGWTCDKIVIDTLSTPNFNVDSACVTPAPGAAPTEPPVFNNPNDNNDCQEHPVWGCYNGLDPLLFDSVSAPQQAPPTFSPTTAAMHFNNFVEGGVGRTASDGGGLSGGAVAGIVIAVLILLGGLSYLIFRSFSGRQGKEEMAEGEDQSEVDFDPERQNRPFTDSFYDERGYQDPDRSDDDDARSYATDDWEGDENASTGDYTDSRFSIGDDNQDQDHRGDYDQDDDGHSSSSGGYEDDDYTEDSNRQYT